MVCIAAFIILCILSIFVGVLSIFRRDLGAKYWKVFRKSWECVGKKVTLQKCETGFKEDIKNSILKKVIIKRPKLVKPISVGIEVAAVLVVVITVWSLVTAVKSGLALWSLGTCDVVKPSACALGAEVCSIDQAEPQNPVEAFGQWFADWGEIVGAIPDKFRSWEAGNFELFGFYVGEGDEVVAIDIFDPGCAVCLQSYKNQVASGFFDMHKTLVVPYPIQNPDGSYKFRNSGVISRYVFAVAERSAEDALRIIEKIYTEYSGDGVIYQTVFNELLSEAAAGEVLRGWLVEFGYSAEEVTEMAVFAESEAAGEKIARNRRIVENDIHAKGIPTMIFEGRKHTGLYKVE